MKKVVFWGVFKNWKCRQNPLVDQVLRRSTELEKETSQEPRSMLDRPRCQTETSNEPRSKLDRSRLDNFVKIGFLHVIFVI
jgi:hypothetical protein